MEFEIGTWHEAEREIRHCPSYYAADHETLKTKAGDYPARLCFKGGYTKPMPEWLLVSVASTRIDGRLYSGFGGNNFASTELEAGADVAYHVQKNAYQIADCVKAGTLTLKPEFEWLASDNYIEAAPESWETLRALASEVA